jgi:high-affinity nickel-transport protein
MSTLLFVLGFGFLLGIRHASDPDHIVAVSTIVSRQRTVRSAGLVGLVWGLGHTLTIAVVGGAITLFRVSISARVGLTMELTVAVMLILLGLLNLFGFPRRVDSGNAHVRPFLVGIVHGLAGSAAVALLVLAAIPSPRWALAYLLVFGGGTIVGMMIITAAIAVPMQLAPQRFTGMQRSLRIASGAISLGFGIFLVHQIGVVDGLFTGTPSWTPR